MNDQPTCSTCRFLTDVGNECRRFPPQMVLWPIGNQAPVTYEPHPVWPYVNPLDHWCGEHREKSAAILARNQALMNEVALGGS